MSDKPGFRETMRGASVGKKKGAAAAPRRAAARNGGKGAASANGAAPPGSAVSERELLNRREQLAKQFTELQWDLGGMAYEMASRDHFRLDVLSKQAARVQEVDAELGQIDRMLKMEESGAAGTCPSCNALQARGAVFCWQCGKEIAAPTEAAKAKPKRPAKGKATKSRAKKA